MYQTKMFTLKDLNILICMKKNDIFHIFESY